MPDYRIFNQKREDGGITLLELVVSMTIVSLVAIMAYRMQKNHSAAAERQKRIGWLQRDLKEATESINKYLVGAGVAGDSVFFDPWKIADGVKTVIPVYRVSADKETLSVYGNFGRGVITLSQPTLNTSSKQVIAKNAASLFVVGDCIFFNAGATQEVNTIRAISNDSTLLLDNNLYIPYPKGTVAFPLMRIKVARTAYDDLKVTVYKATKNNQRVGKGMSVRNLKGKRNLKAATVGQDSVFFKVVNVNLMSGQIQYSLRYSTRLNDKPKTVISRAMTPTVFVRGF